MNPNELTILEPWVSFLKEGRYSEYVDALCEQGLGWWHEMLIPQIALHLAQLTQFPPDLNPPLRLVFLMETLKPSMSPEVYEELYQRFILEEDHEGAGAAVYAGALSIEMSCVNFFRFDVWEERIKKYLDSSDIQISNLARASLLSFKGQIEFYHYGLLQQSLDTFRESMIIADKCSSPSIKMMCAAWQIYPLVYLMQFSDIDAMIMSISPLIYRSDVSALIKGHFQSSLGLAFTVKGQPDKGESILRDLTEQPFFQMLPPPYQLQPLCHLMLALAMQHKANEVTQLADKILAMAVPMGNSLHTGYVHHCLGVAYLFIDDPTKALAHASESSQRDTALNSPITESTYRMLVAQAHIDLGEGEKGIAILTERIDKWRDADLILLATAGHMEIARLFAVRGEMENAREHYALGMAMYPRGGKPFVINRHPDFISNLEKLLFSKGEGVRIWAGEDDAAVKIRAFGDLSLQIGKHKIFDRDWRGRNTKTLLKTLMTLGGKKIAFETLYDIMWPDSDGDIAEQNLKVTIHRLKKVCVSDGNKDLPWLVVKHKKVSLSGVLCHVDALYFETELDHAINNGSDVTRLMNLLNLYEGDFLPGDNADPLIIRKREALRNLFINGVKYLYKVARAGHEKEAALPYLVKAISLDPLVEDLYESLMGLHLAMGYPAKALQTFKAAEKELGRKLGMQPGLALRKLYSQTRNSQPF
jgi:DNA-binding SARP family transcriptional activator